MVISWESNLVRNEFTVPELKSYRYYVYFVCKLHFHFMRDVYAINKISFTLCDFIFHFSAVSNKWLIFENPVFTALNVNVPV